MFLGFDPLLGTRQVLGIASLIRGAILDSLPRVVTYNLEFCLFLTVPLSRSGENSICPSFPQDNYPLVRTV
jgi:hypothetical protein